MRSNTMHIAAMRNKDDHNKDDYKEDNHIKTNNQLSDISGAFSSIHVAGPTPSCTQRDVMEFHIYIVVL